MSAPRTVSRDVWIVALTWAAGSLLLWAARGWLPGLAALGPDCPFHTLTGLPCFACGATRAALRLAAGDVPGALLMNPLAAITLGAAWIGGLIAPFWLALRLPLPHEPRSLPLYARLAAIGILLANWCFLVARGI